jgi:hypothetical protein
MNDNKSRKKKSLATTALGLLMTMGVWTTVNILTESAIATEDGGGKNPMMSRVEEWNSRITALGNDLEMGKDLGILRREFDDAQVLARGVVSDMKKLGLDGDKGADYDILEQRVQETEQRWQRLCCMVEDATRANADPVTHTPPPPLSDFLERTDGAPKPTAEELSQRLFGFRERFDAIANAFRDRPSVGNLEQLEREFELINLDFRAIQEQINQLEQVELENEELRNATAYVERETARMAATIEALHDRRGRVFPKTEIATQTEDAKSTIEVEIGCVRVELSRFKRETKELAEKIRAIESKIDEAVRKGVLGGPDADMLMKDVNDIRRKLNKQIGSVQPFTCYYENVDPAVYAQGDVCLVRSTHDLMNIKSLMLNTDHWRALLLQARTFQYGPKLPMAALQKALSGGAIDPVSQGSAIVTISKLHDLDSDWERVMRRFETHLAFGFQVMEIVDNVETVKGREEVSFLCSKILELENKLRESIASLKEFGRKGYIKRDAQDQVFKYLTELDQLKHSLETQPR